MRGVTITTACICGYEIQFTVRKPKHFQPTIRKITCAGCDSRYLLSIGVGGIQFLGAAPSEFAKNAVAVARGLFDEES
jgi:hypothetical protein